MSTTGPPDPRPTPDALAPRVCIEILEVVDVVVAEICEFHVEVLQLDAAEELGELGRREQVAPMHDVTEQGVWGVSQEVEPVVSRVKKCHTAELLCREPKKVASASLPELRKLKKVASGGWKKVS